MAGNSPCHSLVPPNGQGRRTMTPHEPTSLSRRALLAITSTRFHLLYRPPLGQNDQCSVASALWPIVTTSLRAGAPPDAAALDPHQDYQALPENLESASPG